MDGTMISLFGGYKHSKKYKAEQPLRGATGQENAGIMPKLLPKTLVRHEHRRGKSFPQVEISRRFLCTATPPPSLQFQSLPQISLHGNARQQHHRGNHTSSKGKLGLAIPSIKCRTTQSLPSLLTSKSSSKSTGKGPMKDPQRSSTFDLFRTSRQSRQTAAHRQNFSWDFSPRTEVTKTCKDIENNPPKHCERNVESSRPVHLYMSVEMMDKLLEKRKGLRSDEMLNELIGLPPTKMRVSASCEKKRPQRRDDTQNCETSKDGESRVDGQHPRDEDNDQNASNCKEVTKAISPADEKCVKTTPLKEPRDGDPCGPSKMKTEKGTASEELLKEEDHHGNEMEGEFQDEDEEELGGLDDDEGSDVFDGCKDNEEDDAEEINDDVDSDDEGRGTGQDEDEEDGEQEEDFEDEDDFKDGKAQGDSEVDEVEEEEIEEVGDNGDDNDEEEAEGQDMDDEDDYDAADDDELEEGQGSDDEEDADEEDERTVDDGEMEEELDEHDDGDRDDISDSDNDDEQ